MARTAEKVANILSVLYEEVLSKSEYDEFRTTWSNLRGIAGVTKLYPDYLLKINHVLNKTGYHLIQFDNFLTVVKEVDFSRGPNLPQQRIIEEYLYKEGDNLELDESVSSNRYVTEV